MRTRPRPVKLAAPGPFPWPPLTRPMPPSICSLRHKGANLPRTDLTMRTIEDIGNDFELLDDWEDRYRYLIELGRELPPMAPEEMTEATRVRGCVSQVWMVSETQPGVPPQLRYRGESDAHIVRGLVAVALALFSGKPADEILATDAEAAFAQLGLQDHLTPQRSNGLRSMVARMKEDARAALASAA